MVNVTDVDYDKEIEKILKKKKGDRLFQIFQIQTLLEKKYHIIEERNLGIKLSEYPVNLNSCKDQQAIKDCMWRITEELGEAANCLKNKPWKQDHKETDVLHYLEELSDALHFVIKLFLMSGLDAKGLFEIYTKKALVNKFRQRSGY